MAGLTNQINRLLFWAVFLIFIAKQIMPGRNAPGVYIGIPHRALATEGNRRFPLGLASKALRHFEAVCMSPDE
jgi:hypothetical protein